MARNGYGREFAERIYQQILGFGSYGFPESHAASFALLAYASCWLKRHHPAVFACALLNSQPMGFYGPAQIVQDLRRHGVEVRGVDVDHSHWDCTLERRQDGTLALRLGLRQIKGLSEALATRIGTARTQHPFADVGDLCRRARVERRECQSLARAGALRRLSGHRHRAYWDSAGVERQLPLLDEAEGREQHVALRPPSLAENVLTDYVATGLSLQRHPLSLVRAALSKRRTRRASEVARLPHGVRLRHAGLVTVRQRPGTASGVTFVTLEDETGQVNVVVWKRLAERQRRVLLESVLLGVDGELQESDGVRHLIAHRLHDWSALLPTLDTQSRDFH
jgi:error-prone DNA polymerase